MSRIRFWLAAWAACWLPHALAQVAASNPMQVTLSPGPRMIPVAFPADLFVRVKAVCPGAAVQLTVLDGSRVVSRMSGVGGTGGTAEASAIASAGSSLRLEAHLIRPVPASAMCTVSAEPGRPAGSDEQRSAEAFRAWATAQNSASAPGPGRRAAYESALAKARNAAEDALAAGIAIALVQELGAEGQFAPALAAAEREHNSAYTARDPRARAQLLYYQAVMHLQMEDADASLAGFADALAVARQLGESHEESLALHNLSVAHWELGDCQPALAEAQEALAIRRQLGDREREGYTLMAIAKDYLCLGQGQQSLDTYAAALALWRELHNGRNEASVLNDEGVLYAQLGETEKAQALHRQALSLREGLHDSSGLVESHTNFGNLQLESGHIAEAVLHLERALALARSISFRRGEGYALRDLGRARLEMGDRAAALANLRESIAILRQTGDRGGEAWSLFALAEYDRGAGEPAAAIAALNRALTRERETGNRLAQSVMLVTLAEAREKTDRATALANVTEAIRLIEESRSDLLAPGVRIHYLASKRKAWALRIRLLGHSIGEAFQTSEQAHARALLDALQELEHAPGDTSDPPLVSRMRSLDAAVNAQASALERLPDARGTQAAKIRNAIDRLLTEKEECEARLRVSDSGYAALHMPAPPTLAQTQRELLDAGTVLLEYFAGAEQSYLWAVSSREAIQIPLPPRRQLAEAAGALLHAVTERNRRSTAEPLATRNARFARADAEARRQARLLGHMLLDPVAAQLRFARVLIVPDGPLHAVPFAALPFRRPGAGLVLLGTAAEITSLPSASVLMEMRKAGRYAPRSTPALIIADPVFSSGDPRVKLSPHAAPAENSLPRLPWSREEAETIRGLAPHHDVVELLGFQANARVWRRADLPTFGLIHVEAHTRIDNSRPELSGVILSQVRPDGSSENGLLRLHDVYDLHLRARLVVLSACETSFGKEMEGEGLVTLSRGFLYAGARSVIGALWSVDDQGTAQFMEHFYGAMWSRGLSPAQALLNTRRWMMGEPRWAAPYYWAAFTISGDGN